MSIDREELGKLVRSIWIDWAIEQPITKSSWVAPWESLSEPDREVDRRIGEGIACAILLHLSQQEALAPTKAYLEALIDTYSRHPGVQRYGAFKAQLLDTPEKQASYREVQKFLDDQGY